jgi:hypothetical protein
MACGTSVVASNRPTPRCGDKRARRIFRFADRDPFDKKEWPNKTSKGDLGMGLRAFALGLVLLAASATASSATIRISGDRGGRIGTYIETFSTLRHTGEGVIIDGPCLSACTLIVGMLPADQVCVTSRARLGFHAAWRPDSRGRPVRSTAGTQVLMEVYPPKVRNWIRHKGGLSAHMIYMRGRDLTAVFRRCR